MKSWKIGLSVIGGVIIFAALMNIVSPNTNIDSGVTSITPSVFYTGVTFVVLSIMMLCVTIIFCTTKIIEAINRRN